MDELIERTDLINEGIRKYFKLSNPVLQKACLHLIESGGKRLRPLMLILSAEACGGREKMRDVLPAAVSIELIHSFTLIHDDIMDEDVIRRGKPTVHVVYGLPLAILAGDVLFSKAFEVLSMARVSPRKISEASSMLAATCIKICEGQQMDLEFERRDVREEEYMLMIQNKTGALYEASAGIGAILGGGTKKEIELLSSYGRLTGSGFQIYDDVLGLVSPTEKLGKSRGIDLLRKKKTLIMIHALEHGFRMEKDVDLDSVIKKLDTLGSIEYAEKKALKMIGDGKRALSRIKNSRAKNLLLRLADYMVRRKF